ncbi:MAG: hypothetical protein ACYC1K_01900 [Minisyncoccota bacterium]
MDRPCCFSVASFRPPGGGAMRHRVFWVILALVLVVPANLAGQVIVKPPQTMCPACSAPAPEKKAAPKPKVTSKPAVRQSTPPVVVARKADTTYVKTIGGVDSMVVTMQFDTLNVNFSGKIELELSDGDRSAMRQSQNQIFARESRRQRGWWSRNWGWPVGVAIVGTGVGLIGQNNGWWGGRNIVQCTAINSPGTCLPYK